MKTLFKRKLVAFSIVLSVISGLLSANTIVFAASGDTVVYLTKTGDCYHVDGCSCLRKSKIETTLKNAVDKGYSPCSKCKPGTLDASASNTDTKATVSKTSDSKAVAPKSSANTSVAEQTYIVNTNS